MRKECFLWSKLSHPHLIRMFESFEAEDATFIISELAPGGHLLDHVIRNGNPGLVESEARILFKQIVSAVDYLHTQVGLVHRDIKLENILLDKDKSIAKLSDFGLSEPIYKNFWDEFYELDSCKEPFEKKHERSMSTFTMPRKIPNNATACTELPTFAPGSVHYCAPEVLKSVGPAQFSNDIWSLGCVLHALLTGSLPFNDSYLPRLQMSIINGKWDKSRLDSLNLSDSVKHLISNMLSVNEQDRWTIRHVLQHSWLSE